MEIKSGDKYGADVMLLMDTVMLVMRAIRMQMRSECCVDLSMPQFRALAFLDRRTGASLSDVAEHVGIALPSTSKLIDGLVARGLVSRAIDPADRRRIILALTETGRAELGVAREVTERHLAERLAGLTTSERVTVERAMQILRVLFAPAEPPDTERKME